MPRTKLILSYPCLRPWRLTASWIAGNIAKASWPVMPKIDATLR